MKYYKISSAVDFKEVGPYPQSEDVNFIGDVQKEFMISPEFIDFDFDLPEPILLATAIQTSMISVAAIPYWFFVIDDFLLEFLKSFSLGAHQSWKITSWQKRVMLSQYNLFLLCESSQEKYIDFKISEFYVGSIKDFGYRGENLIIENYGDFKYYEEKLYEEKCLVKASKVVFNLKNTNVDMFRISEVRSKGYYVSEKLKNAIQDSGFTGIRFTEINQIRNTEALY